MKYLYIYDDQAGKQIYFQSMKDVNRFAATVAEETIEMENQEGRTKKQLKEEILKHIYKEYFW